MALALSRDQKDEIQRILSKYNPPFRGGPLPIGAVLVLAAALALAAAPTAARGARSGPRRLDAPK